MNFSCGDLAPLESFSLHKESESLLSWLCPSETNSDAQWLKMAWSIHGASTIKANLQTAIKRIDLRLN